MNASTLRCPSRLLIILLLSLSNALLSVSTHAYDDQLQIVYDNGISTPLYPYDDAVSAANATHHNPDVIQQQIEDVHAGLPREEYPISNGISSTLSSEIIESVDDQPQVDEVIAPPSGHTTMLSSQRYRDKWSRITQAQEDKSTRWIRNKRQRENAEHIKDMQQRDITASHTRQLLKRYRRIQRDRRRASVSAVKPPKRIARKGAKGKIYQNVTAPNHYFANTPAKNVWVNRMMPRLMKRMPDPYSRKLMLEQVHQQSYRHGLNPNLILALIQIESNFKPKVNSYVGAQGLMQIMPFWKKEIGRTSDNLHDIKVNIHYGCRILKHYLNIEKGRLVPALARYNGSYGRMKYPNKVIGAWMSNWKNS
ncbi:MAG: transglycosylase SLT domain-containing protein [Pseudomonadota bacterium]